MALREMIGLVACCLVLCELPQLAHSSGSGQVSSYRSGSSICRRRERRYVDSYKCLENTDSRICWLLVKQLDRSGCVQPCYAFHNQECVPVNTDCAEVPGLCMAGGKCCNTS